MKKAIIFSFLITISSFSVCQNYYLTFTGEGVSYNLDSVIVENLTKNLKTILKGESQLHLTNTTGFNKLNLIEYQMFTYPNPCYGNTTFEFSINKPEKVNISLYNLKGELICVIDENFEQGKYSYLINGLGSGIYLLKYTSKFKNYSTSIVSTSALTKEISIKEINSSSVHQIHNSDEVRTKIASNSDVVDFSYDIGDIVKFTGCSGEHKNIVIFDPLLSGEIKFLWEVCQDADNNHYTTVRIGNQTWMAENLRTTRYSDMTPIEIAENNNWWKNATEGYFCWFKDNEELKYKHGALYNWYAVNTKKLSPEGWHVPTDQEWNTLFSFLNQSDVGTKLKDEGNSNWHDDNTVGKNSTGFSAIPGGYRDATNGYFASDCNHSAYYWTSSLNTSGSAALYKLFSSYTSYVSSGGSSFKSGFSVRCIKDGIKID